MRVHCKDVAVLITEPSHRHAASYGRLVQLSGTGCASRCAHLHSLWLVIGMIDS